MLDRRQPGTSLRALCRAAVTHVQIPTRSPRPYVLQILTSAIQKPYETTTLPGRGCVIKNPTKPDTSHVVSGSAVPVPPPGPPAPPKPGPLPKTCPSTPPSPRAKKGSPNIVLFLTDDMDLLLGGKVYFLLANCSHAWCPNYGRNVNIASCKVWPHTNCYIRV